MAVPTLPAPAMATFTAPLPTARPSVRRVPPRSRRSSSTDGLFQHGQVQHVAFLADEVGDVESGHAGPGDGHEVDPAGHAEIAQRLARPRLGQDVARRGRDGPGVAPLPTDRLGQEPAHTWSMVHVTVATVGMPSRW